MDIKNFNIGDVFKSEESCKICGESEVRLVSRVGRNFQKLDTVICTGCGLVHSYPIPSKAVLDEYYRKQYRSEYKNAYKPQRKHILRYSRYGLQRIERLLEFAKAGDKLLDIGSGSGEFIYLAKLAGFDVKGLEPHEGYSEYTRKTFDADIITSPLEYANIAEGSLDVVTMHHVLEHLQYPINSLAIINKWIKMGGLIVIDVPNIEHSLHAASTRFHYAHIYNFNHKTLKATLTKAGFEVIENQNYKGTILFAKKVAETNLEKNILMKDNYLNLWDSLNKVHEIEYHKKKKKIIRFLKKCKRYPIEFVHAILLWKPKYIVASEFRKWKAY